LPCDWQVVVSSLTAVHESSLLGVVNATLRFIAEQTGKKLIDRSERDLDDDELDSMLTAEEDDDDQEELELKKKEVAATRLGCDRDAIGMRWGYDCHAIAMWLPCD
jgi:hypothetical protein